MVVGAGRILSLLEYPVEARDGGEWIGGSGSAERSNHDEAVRGEVIHQGQVLSAPPVGTRIDDTIWRVLFGVVPVPVRPDENGMTIPALRKVVRAIDVEALLVVAV